MAQYQTLVTVMAKGSIAYRFRCVKCGKEAFAHRPVQETETYETYDRHINVADFKKRSQAQIDLKLKKRLDEIEGMSFIKKCELAGGVGKCSHCGEQQPWSKMGMIAKPIAVFTDVAIGIGIGAVITVLMGIFGKFYDTAFLLALPPGISALVGLIIGIFSHRKYSKEMSAAIREFQEISQSELPEIVINHAAT